MFVDSTSRGASWPNPFSTTGATPVTVPLDWNGDAIPELEITLNNYFGQIQVPENERHLSATIRRPAGSAAETAFVLLAASPSSSSPAALELGNVIGSDQAYSYFPEATLLQAKIATTLSNATPSAPGNFLTFGVPAYLGVRFEVADQVKYGWARLNFRFTSLLNPPNAIGGVLVSSLAYEDAGQGILAGQITDLGAADFNRDGIADGEDLAVWSSGIGGGDASDADGDGDSDGNDFLVWQQQFGTSSFVSAAQPVASAVPEPSGELLAIYEACSVFTYTYTRAKRRR
ncbi:MAG: hypothetical protein JNL18_01405 [Planctomycetaceae bacterium]|nr:hypothetical protein [Planctomycetaceae bacterium]